MKMRRTTKLFPFLLAVFVMTPGLTPQGRQRIISPEVRNDRTVTFRFVAPRAHQVLVSVEDMDGLRSLRLGEDGVWSITLGPLEPELYSYNFIVDGVATIDPRNPVIKIGTGTTHSLLDIPGAPPLFYN